MSAMQIILLGSIDASLRAESQLEGSQLRYRSSERALEDTCTSLGLSKLEVHVLTPQCWLHACNESLVA